MYWFGRCSCATPSAAKPVLSLRIAVRTTAIGQSLVTSSFYDRSSERLEQLLRDLFDHTAEEVAVPHTLAPAFDRFRDVVADATVVRLIRASQRSLRRIPASPGSSSVSSTASLPSR